MTIKQILNKRSWLKFKDIKIAKAPKWLILAIAGSHEVNARSRGENK